jgi:hypothetical protein
LTARCGGWWHNARVFSEAAVPTIELTDEQRQALQAERGQPVHVIDPTTQQRYVLLAREQYESMCSLLKLVQGQGPPGAAPFEAPSSRAGKAERVRLRDLPTPAEVAAEAERWCKKYGSRGQKGRREMEEQLKLQYYYGGQPVYIVRTPDGPVVIPIPDRYKDTPDLRHVLLTPEERPHACLEIPPLWWATTSEILT